MAKRQRLPSWRSVLHEKPDVRGACLLREVPKDMALAELPTKLVIREAEKDEPVTVVFRFEETDFKDSKPRRRGKRWVLRRRIA